MKRWSSLQREIYDLIAPSLGLQIHLSRYRMNSRHGSTDLPRYWLTLNGETLFDYPKQFMAQGEYGACVRNLAGYELYYPYSTDISDISALIREYIDTPKDEVFSKRFKNDFWGLSDILKAADRRIGKKRLEQFRESMKNPAVLKILECRLR